MRHHVIALVLALTLAVAAVPVGADQHPNLDRGFAPDKVFDLGSVDSIDLFSGRLSLTIATGQRVPVSSGLSYGLSLVYNSTLWKYTFIDRVEGSCTEAEPDEAWNAGAGWMLSLGRLTRELRGSETVWTYIGPDGGDHRFYTRLHDSDPLQANRLFTRDGTYLRLVVNDSANPKQAIVEFSDGSRHHFEEEAPNTSRYRLWKITDGWKDGSGAYPNYVEVYYYAADTPGEAETRAHWDLVDSLGRIQTVAFITRTGSPSTVVDEVILTATAGQTLHYQFEYASGTTTRPCKETCRVDNTLPNWTVDLSLLASVTAKDDTGTVLETWRFPSYNLYTALQGRPYCTTAGDIPGTIATVELPTLGTMSYQYADHEILGHELPPDCEPAVCQDHSIIQKVTGISRKDVADPYTGTTGHWDYLRYSHSTTEYRNLQVRDVLDELVTVVTSPDGDARVHPFTTWISWGGGTQWDYALPYTLLAKDSTNQRFLSGQTFDGGVTVSCLGHPRCLASGTILREEYVTYEADTVQPTTNDRNNRREAAHRTIFRDDPSLPSLSCTPFTGGSNQCAERLLTRSSFDGLGHYRAALTTSNFLPTTEWHREFIGFNPDVNGVYRVYPDNYQPWLADKPWVLGTYAAKIAEEPEGTKAGAASCFDRDALGYPTTGALLRTRTYKLANNPSPPYGLPGMSGDDVVTQYDHDAHGNVTVERTYGGDGAGLSTSTALCQLSLVDPSFRIDHAYQNGVRATSHWSNDDGVSVGFNTLDLTIDDDTGLPVETEDTAGLVTSLGYDVLGRLTTVTPSSSPVNGGARTRYTYTPANGSTRATVTVEQFPNTPNSTDILAKQTYTYDGFGRLAKESTLLPDSSCQTPQCLNQRLTSYDAMGRATSVSEWQPDGTTGSAIEATTYSGFDSFGRVGRITPPDTDLAATPPIDHDTVLTHKGERTTTRRTMIGTSRDTSGTIVESPSETTESYDGQGRLRTVTEPSGGDSGSVTTQYAYDVGGRLASATTSYLQQGAPVGQTRSFIYDNRGFLRYEDMPEKTPPSGGRSGECASHDVCYSGYDALGHVGRVDDGANNLEYAYDLAGRVTSVTTESSSEEGSSSLKAFTYDSIPGTATGYSLGKLVRAVRHNYYDPAHPTFDFWIIEEYHYGATGGRVDQRTTEASSLGECTQGFTWTDLGAPATVIYPTCTGTNTAGTARTVTLGYSKGLLTSVADQGRTYASSISYHPNTMLKSVAHGNGVTVAHALDPHAMRRPGSIATSGVTGTPGNWASGAYAYDGAGNITRIGEEWYTYDAVSRLSKYRTGPDTLCPNPNESGFLYDPFGNIVLWWMLCGAGEGWADYWPDSSTNRLAMQGYDASGNTLGTWAAPNAMQLGYYPFNDLRSAVGTGLNRLYGYTADGERLVDYDELSTDPAGKFTITLRDLSGKVLRSFRVTTGSPGTWTEKEDWITRDGQLLATVDTTVQGGVARHVHLDHLGTPRLITSASGAGLESHTYLPFGLEVTEVGPLFERMKFTGHERDLASGLDYMHARYYSPYVNRFLSVDPGRDNNLKVPQSWNLYGYVRNNPVNLTDPDGESAWDWFKKLVTGELFEEWFKKEVDQQTKSETELTGQETQEQQELLQVAGLPTSNQGAILGTGGGKVAEGAREGFKEIGGPIVREGGAVVVIGAAAKGVGALSQVKNISGKNLLKALQKAGATVRPGNGSHMVVEFRGRTSTVPVHGNRSLGKGLLNDILKDLGLK